MDKSLVYGCELTQVHYLCVCNDVAIIYLMAVVKEGQKFGKFGLNFCCLRDESGAMSLCNSYHRWAESADVVRLQKILFSYSQGDLQDLPSVLDEHDFLQTFLSSRPGVAHEKRLELVPGWWNPGYHQAGLSLYAVNVHTKLIDVRVS